MANEFANTISIPILPKIFSERKRPIESKITEKRNPPANLDSIPLPYYSAFDMNKYTTNIKLAGMTEEDKCFPIVTSRGCTNKCTFCYRVHKGIRSRSLENIIAEIKYLNSEYGITYFFAFVSSSLCFISFLFSIFKKSTISFILSSNFIKQFNSFDLLP